MDAKPTARSENLIIEELGEGAVVYDSLTQQAHSLDAEATMIWRVADGSRTVSELAEESGLQEPVVIAGLDQLQARGLLAVQSGVSRRTMLRRSATIGAAAVAAVPIIETVVVPTAAAHASTPAPPEEKVLLGVFTPDEMSAVFTVPLGLKMPGRYLIRRGTTKVFVLTPAAVFGVSVAPLTFTFTDDLVNSKSYPPYRYHFVGTDGVGNPIDVMLHGATGVTQTFHLGPLLHISVTRVAP